jgi:hypothetical protein
MLSVTLHAAVKSDCGFVGSKHNTCEVENFHNRNFSGMTV